MNEWNQYQKITKGNQPRPLATYLKRYLNKEMSIIDIGCGAGTDSIYFIEQALRKEGVFAGTFFGVNDEWYKTANDLTFHRKSEIEELSIKEFNENEYDGYCVGEQGNIVNKHWHIYEIIAIKNK